MRQSLAMLLVCLLLAACRRNEEPSEKHFGGKPVDRWLEAAKNPDPKTRKQAVEVLGNVGPIDERAIPALIEAVKDRDARVRDAAVLSLSKIGPPASAAESVLDAATRDTDATVSKHAATALQRVRGQQ